MKSCLFFLVIFLMISESGYSSDLGTQLSKYALDNDKNDQLVKVEQWALIHPFEQGVLLVHYFDSKGILYLLTVANQSIYLSQIGPSEMVIEEMKRFRDSILEFNKSDFIQSSALLFDLFFSFDSKFEYYQEIIIVPDQSFPAIPFELLISGSPEQDKPFRELPYLFLNANFRYLPGLEYMFDQNEAGFNSMPVELLGIAPGFVVNNNSGSDSGRPFLKPLPGSIKEVKTIAKYTGGETLIGDVATKSNFVEAIKRSGAIHLSTHGNPPGYEPGFYFSSSPETGLMDSFLGSSEIQELDFNSEFIVLSTCGLGWNNPSVGNEPDLTEILLRKGLENVIFSFWDLSDEAAPILMEAFYNFLISGSSMQEALSEAKKQYLFNADRSFANPFFWGGLSVAGSGGKIIFKNKMEGQKPRQALLASGFGAVFLLIFFRVGL